MGVAAGLLECIAAGEGPAALILAQADAVVALGAVVAKALFGTTLPVLVVGQRRYDQMASGGAVHISAAVNRFKIANPSTQSMIARIRPTPAPGLVLAPPTGGEGSADPPEIELSESDRATLAGEQGEAAKQALEIVVAMARITGATRLLGVRSARLHAPRFVGPAGLKFAQHFAGLGGKFAVPTTMGASSEASAALGEVYTSMGATSDDTSVPAELPGQKVGDDSPASDYPELLDVAIALTARAPDVPLQSWPRKQQEQEKEALAPTLPSALADGACCEDKVCVCSATATIQAVDITV
jgi:hypothetical protein